MITRYFVIKIRKAGLFFPAASDPHFIDVLIKSNIC